MTYLDGSFPALVLASPTSLIGSQETKLNSLAVTISWLYRLLSIPHSHHVRNHHLRKHNSANIQWRI